MKIGGLQVATALVLAIAASFIGATAEGVRVAKEDEARRAVVAEDIAKHADDEHHVGPACGTVHGKPPAEDIADLAEFSKRRLGSFEPVTLSVVVHLSWSEQTRAKSYIPYERIQVAFDQANKVLAGTSSQGSAGTGLAVDTGFRLRLDKVKYYEVTSSTQSAAEGTLMGSQDFMHTWQAANAMDPTKYVNVWVTDTGVAGGRVDYMPWRSLAGGESNPHWGWIQNWGIFPNVNYAAAWGSNHVFNHYNTGDSLAHEFGHFLNLYHTFNAGCYSLVGDYVADTPAEKSPWRGTCRNNKVKSGGLWRPRNSCTNQAGNDDISNIMDYSYDNCRDHFTAGQASAMQAAIMRYKPKLYAHSLAHTGGGGDNTGVLSSTNNPTPPPSPSFPTCTTVGGPYTMRDGRQCRFPFRFKGRTFNDCASIAANDKPYMGRYKGRRPKVKTEDNFWCPTVSVYSTRNRRTRHKWGYCSCAEASTDAMLDAPLERSFTSDGRNLDALNKHQDNANKETESADIISDAASTATKNNWGDIAPIIALATMGSLMVVGIGAAAYHRRSLGATDCYDKIGSLQQSAQNVQPSNEIMSPDCADAAFSLEGKV
jgi:hypothetical protein